MAKKKRKTKEESIQTLKQFLDRMAKKLRARRTQWEQSLYVTLKDLGYKFEFQKPVVCRGKYGYILDFVLTDYNIVIEADGVSTHGSKEQQKKDGVRTRRLKKEGYSLIRLWNRQISTYSKEQINDIIQTKIELLKLS
jgi:very-short-patch-repair endonuclease